MHPVNQLDNSRLWAEANPNHCPCQGYGWLRSDYDTLHECHLHKGAPHPEADYEGAPEVPFDYAALFLTQYRAAYKHYQQRAVSDHKLTPAQFNVMCDKERLRPFDKDGALPRRRWGDDAKLQTASDFCDAAETTIDFLDSHAAEVSAQAAGFSCALERQWDEDAADERRERAEGGRSRW